MIGLRLFVWPLLLFPMVALRAPGQTGPPASISGTVLDAGSGQPIAEVTVSVIPLAGGTRTEAQTDASGAYRLSSLESGQYRVSASKPGFDRNPFLVGSGASSKAVTLKGGQDMRAVDFRLKKTGVISGRITDAGGLPVAGAQVVALAVVELTGRKWIRPAAVSVRTDDRGQYRLYDLSQDRYYVRVDGPSQTKFFGTNGERARPSKGGLSFLPTYYPGVDLFCQAAPVTVFPGQESPGIDVRLPTGRLFSISGRVGSLAGSKAGADVAATVWLENLDDADGEAPHRTCGPGSQFQFEAVRPGLYRITAYRISKSVPGGILAGSVEVTVRDRDLEDVSLEVHPGFEISGIVRAEDGQPVPAGVLQRTTILLMPERQEPGIPRPEPAVFGGGGQFAIAAPAGKYWLRVDGPSDGLYVKSMRYGSMEIGERMFSLVPRETLDIVVSTSGSSLTVSVQNSEGKPVPQAFVITERPAKRTDGAPIRIGWTADQEGLLAATGLTPGTYRLYAFESGDLSSVRRLDLTPHSGRAKTVDLLAGGQQKAQLVPIGPEP